MSVQTSRRDFLKTSGAVLGGVLLYSSGPIAMLAPGRAWALELKSLTKAEGEALLRFTRHLYPHDGLEDAVYALVVKDLDTEAAKDKEVQALLRKGVAELNSKAGGNWLALAEREQFKLVEAIEGTPFFEKVRSTAIVSLYDNDMAYAYFGYPGASFQHGGYLHRGFNDLDWLPEPPPEASPPAY
ncbi:MAG: twin-arginine translocation signal domain-containing protein [Xanthomonadaceae bacterium]|nr:twin-arginine translocation signal domain-containing protein [Xanthomonadaceae bacterium]